MASLKVWTLLLLAAVVSSNSAPSRIAGGDSTTIDYYPSAVQVDVLLAIVWSQGCTGTILTSRYILSAASCFSGTLFLPRFRRVRAGSSYRNTGGQLIVVDQVFNHPAFGQNGRDSDITVVRLTEPLVYDPVVQQGTIVAPGSSIPDNIPVIQIGWGATADELASEVLQETTVFTINRQLCSNAYEELDNDNNVITENMICVGGPAGAGACSGDTGGPVYYDSNGALIVIGVVSFQEGCGNATFPSVNTAVSPFTNWIIETVGQ